MNLDAMVREAFISGYSTTKRLPVANEVRYRVYDNTIGAANLFAFINNLDGTILHFGTCKGNVANPGLWEPNPISTMDGVIERTPQIEVVVLADATAAAKLINNKFYCPDGENAAGYGIWQEVVEGSWAVPDAFIATTKSLPFFTPAYLHFAAVDGEYATYYSLSRESANGFTLFGVIQLHNSWLNLL